LQHEQISSTNLKQNQTKQKKEIMKQFMLLLALSLLILACENENENETSISTNFSSESHNTGKNCMNCHKSGGNGEGLFIVAGSVYQSSLTSPFPNGTVRLTSSAQNTGNLIKSIEVDALGNFYTTQAIDFGTGLYVSVLGTNGEVKHMSSKITTGQCNNCHGNTVAKIWLQ